MAGRAAGCHPPLPVRCSNWGSLLCLGISARFHSGGHPTLELHSVICSQVFFWFVGFSCFLFLFVFVVVFGFLFVWFLVF